MQFNSIEFLFCFFPVFLIVYYWVPGKLQAAALVVGSILFYALSSGGNEWWILLLIGITGTGYVVQRFLQKKRKSFLLGAYIITSAAVLVFFKLYLGGTLLPAGISFYLFQIVATLTDVARGRIAPYGKLTSFFRDMVMFPKLLSGPLMKPQALQSQPKTVRLSFQNIREGLHKLILGLSMKVILANNLGGLWAQPAVTGYENISTPAAWIALTAYAMQLYLDFYGYSLMAIGIGKMLGFDLPANFLEPYSARSVGEFYRRWHATLGVWFKEYVYIPLGGNRRGKLRTVLNIAVVWLFTGLWHGVGGSYLLWAGFLCLLIVNERLWLGKLLDRSRVLSHIYVVAIILFSWIPFAVGSWDRMVVFTGRLFGALGTALEPGDYIEWLDMYGPLLLGSAALMTPWPARLWWKIRGTAFADLIIFVLFWAVVYYISTEAQNPFMYFEY